jgi:hypothetical protein
MSPAQSVQPEAARPITAARGKPGDSHRIGVGTVENLRRKPPEAAQGKGSVAQATPRF